MHITPAHACQKDKKISSSLPSNMHDNVYTIYSKCRGQWWMHSSPPGQRVSWIFSVTVAYSLLENVGHIYNSPCTVHVACCLYIQARFNSLTLMYLITTECYFVLLTLCMHARGLRYILGLCVCLSVPLIPATTYTHGFLLCGFWFVDNFCSKDMAWKSQYAND